MEDMGMAITCPQCNYSNPDQNAYCQNCGLRLPSPDEVSQASGSSGLPPPTPGYLAAHGVASGDALMTTPSAGILPGSAAPVAAPLEPAKKSRLPLVVIAIVGTFVVLFGFLALGALLLMSDVGEIGTSTVSDFSTADLESFVPQPAAGPVAIEGETISSDAGTVSLVLPEGGDWILLATNGGYIDLEHPKGYLTVGVQHSTRPTSPDALMEEEMAWMQTEFPDADVVAGPEYWEIENGSGVTFALYYEESKFLGVESYNIDVYTIGTDSSGLATLWINFYGWEEDWEEFHAAVLPVFESIRSPHFE
jgi:hypothetical protein